MTSRTRHSPVQVARSSYSGSTSSIPRHHAVPESTMSFAQSSVNSDVMNPQYTLSSNAHGSRHQYHQWSTTSNHLPRDDNYLSVTAYDPVSYLDSYYSPDVMSTSDLMDSQYGYADGETMSRHAAQTADDIIMNDCLAMDFDTCNPMLDGNDLGSTWTYSARHMAPPSPPDEDRLDRYFAMRSSQNRHDSMLREAAVVENLGPSKLLPYSGSRHSAVQPRPIRPSSGRHSNGSSSPELPPSPPTDDNSGKITARNDPRYNAKPDKEGWYHCPLMKEYRCSHKPTKQKCIYAKYLDSHLRPYKCKYAKAGDDCEDTRFSSNACLFRHEREAHGKHNHGLNPYLCEYMDCDRSKDGNGFPRRWNQRDHMKRVHGWREPDTITSEDRHATDQSKRRRGPGGLSSVPMRRSTSYARTAVPVNVYSRDSRGSVNVSRHSAQAQYVNPMQTGNMTGYPMDGVSFTHQQFGYGYQAVY